MTPSDAVLQDRSTEWSVTDALGRRLSLRTLNALDKLRLFKAAGPELAQNPPWLGMAMLASSVRAIDDIPVPPPTNEQQIEALVGRLGDAGLATISEALDKVADSTPHEAAASAGNLLGTPT